MEKPPSTPDMSARETEDMVNSMLRDSPLPDTERSDERLPEDDGNDKPLAEKDGEKLPEGGDAKLPEETPTGKLIKPCVWREKSCKDFLCVKNKECGRASVYRKYT